MRYRIAKKRMKRNVLLNLWINHMKSNVELLHCDNNTLSELSGLVLSISKKMLDYEYDRVKIIQESMLLRNFQFHHYLEDRIYGNKY